MDIAGHVLDSSVQFSNSNVFSCPELCANYENGVLKVHCAFETGLAPGASVKVFCPVAHF